MLVDDIPTQNINTIPILGQNQNTRHKFLSCKHYYLVSIEKSILNVQCPDNLGFRKNELNFSKFKVNTVSLK